MKVFSIWRCAGSAGVYLSVESGKAQMSDTVVIIYNGEPVLVSKEIADFLEQDRKREQAQEKQDERHLSKSEFETVLFCSECVRRPVGDEALRNLRLENLRKAVDGLGDQGRDLIEL